MYHLINSTWGTLLGSFCPLILIGAYKPLQHNLGDGSDSQIKYSKIAS